MSDRQQVQGRMYAVPEAKSSSVPVTLPGAIPSIPFRVTADFVVEVKTVANYLQRPNLTSEERRLLLTVLTTPEALNRMCRLAIVSDIETHPGLLEDQFFGPQSDDILAALMPYLSSEDQTYWTRMQQQDPPGNYLLDMFCEFKAVLRRVVVEDVTTGETIPLQTRRDRVL